MQRLERVLECVRRIWVVLHLCMRVSLSVFVHLCADSPPLWNEIKSEKWGGGVVVAGGCHRHAATEQRSEPLSFHSLLQPAASLR